MCGCSWAMRFFNAGVGVTVFMGVWALFWL